MLQLEVTVDGKHPALPLARQLTDRRVIEATKTVRD